MYNGGVEMHTMHFQCFIGKCATLDTLNQICSRNLIERVNQILTENMDIITLVILNLLERAVPSTALVVRETETLSKAFAFVNPQRRLLHPDHHDLHRHHG